MPCSSHASAWLFSQRRVEATTWMLLLSLLCCLDRIAAQTRGIPGSTQTLSGYDTELGTDAVCWTSVSAEKYEGEVYPFPNPLVENFSIAGNITLREECPIGNNITAFVPEDHEGVYARSFYRIRLRTGTWYNYRVRATFNLTSLEHKYFVSDTGPTVAFQVILCINGVSGFCSPFIHEEANERIIRDGGEVMSVAIGDKHGGSHVHSPKVFRNLTFGDGPIYELNVEVPMLVNHESDFYAIAAVQFFLGDEPGDITTRWDMANALVEGQRLITYQNPAEILEIPAKVLVFGNILRGISAAVIFFLLAQTIYHRNHQVLKLSQQPFLVVFLIAALVATIGTAMLELRTDFSCRWSKFVIVSSLQLVLAVTAGRMWRINHVISPLLAQTLRKKESGWDRFFQRLLRRGGMVKFTKIRTEFQPWHLTVAVTILTVPQILIQMAAALWQEETLDIEYNADESVGRAVCTNNMDIGHSLFFYGFYLFVFLILLVMFLAHMTRHLPSLFNETEVIFNTGVSSLLVLALGVAVVIITDDPNTSPAIFYLAWCVQVFAITLNATCRIMLPKLCMVWRGQTVLVSKLVAEHAKNVREDDEVYLSKSHGGVRVTGLSSRFNQQLGYSGGRQDGKSTRRRLQQESNSQDLAKELEDFEATSHIEAKRSEQNTEIIRESEDTAIPRGDAPSYSETVQEKDGLVQPDMESNPQAEQKPGSTANGRRVVFKVNPEGSSTEVGRSLGNKQKSVLEPVVIYQDETPPKRLILKMCNLQAHLAEINRKIMSGMAVERSEWEMLRRLSTRMGDTFHNVSFGWEDDGVKGDMDASSPEEEEENFQAEEFGGTRMVL